MNIKKLNEELEKYLKTTKLRLKESMDKSISYSSEEFAPGYKIFTPLALYVMEDDKLFEVVTNKEEAFAVVTNLTLQLDGKQFLKGWAEDTENCSEEYRQYLKRRFNF